ncbi:MAG: hypothetical protein JWO96_558 [Candidatus Saccharibacteria bacterium]|nr:hypothetical protein [Candidatus Saccharibacteria bacterium]
MQTYDIPFIPSSDDSVKTMMKLARPQKGETAVDLGAGDGKLVIALAQRGVYVTGVEIDEERWSLINARIKISQLQDLAKTIHGNLWEQDLSNYDLIVLYGVTSIMERLESKIKNEAKSTCRVVSNRFEFPTWQPAEVLDHVYLYRLQKAQ